MLAMGEWRSVSWRHGTKGRFRHASPLCSVRVADGPTQRIRTWVSSTSRRRGLADRRTSRQRRAQILPLATCPPHATQGARRTIKARWICEQAHQQLKEELGLDHFEGRSWHGLHRHALMTMIAYAFLQHRRLASARREKKSTSHHHSQACQRYVMPSSLTACAGSISDVRIVENWICNEQQHE